MQPLLNPWQRFFAKYNIECNLSEVEIPKRAEGEDFLLVWPKEVSASQIIEIFATLVHNSGLVLFWSGFREVTITPDGKEEEILAPSMVHERSNEAGSYTKWTKSCVEKSNAGLVSTGGWDRSLTVWEAVLYNCFMMDTYGQEFINNVYSYQECFGSKRSIHGGSVAIEWYLQDIKVCLRLRG